MLTQIEAVIFDLDGTLLDSMWMWPQIDVEYLARFDCTPPEDMAKEIEGMGFTETAMYFKERFAIPHTIEEIKQDWLLMARGKYAHEVALKPGAFSFLQKLKANGIKTGIASSNSRDLIEIGLAANRVEHYIDCITTSCDVAKGKPAPDVYLHTAAVLGAAPKRCLVFEDVPMGILAGKNAGMRVCAVEDDFSKKQTAEKKQLADYYIASYDEISI